MPLAAITVENYRSFADRARCALRPLTLLFGYNSSGKSALLRLLPIVAASAPPESGGPLALDAMAARDASFRDLLARQNAGLTLRLGFDWDDALVDVAIRDVPERKIQILEELTARSSSNSGPPLRLRWDIEQSISSGPPWLYEFDYEQHSGKVRIPFAGLVPSVDRGLPFAPLLERIARNLSSLGRETHWLSSLRAVPLRDARFAAPPKRLAQNGENADQLLAYDSLQDGALGREVSAWFESATGHRLIVRRHAGAGEERFALLLSPTRSAVAIEIPVLDTGEGMAQVLPVIVLGALARLGRLAEAPLLAIEHPELHLHPAAHADLAAFFCALAAGRSPPTTVIETHSENFLLRVQVAIARGDLSPDRVIVHWVRALPDGRSVLDTITFDEAARPQGSNWPPGVFSEDTAQARELLRLRKARGLA